MNKAAGFLIGVIVLAGVGSIVWYHYGPSPDEAAGGLPPASYTAAATPPAATTSAGPEYRVPEPAPTPEEPAGPKLPALADSDAAVRGELQTLVGQEPVEAFLIPDQIIRRWVAFIDGLDRDGLPLAQRPIRSPGGALVVSDTDGQTVLAPDNAQRYAPYLAVVQAIDAKALVAFYFRYYPLFQRAYEGLGYGGRYFNTRLVHVLDHLLAAPAIAQPPVVIKFINRYKFADPALEDLSFGQKLLIRLGADGGATVKTKLREIRAAIIAGIRQPSAAGVSP
jgi:hypothetical protein